MTGQLGLSAIGALLGFTLAMFILSLGNGGVIQGVGRTVFIVVFVVVFAILIHFFETALVILGTAISGSFAFVYGLDIFLRTGFTLIVRSVLTGNGVYQTSSAVYGMIGGFVVGALAGTLLQWYQHRRGGYKPAHQKHVV